MSTLMGTQSPIISTLARQYPRILMALVILTDVQTDFQPAFAPTLCLRKSISRDVVESR